MIKKLGIGLLLVIILLLCLFFLSKSRSFQFFGGLVNHIDTDKSIVALTFDDGPSSNTTKILDILDKNKIKASFFLIGKDIESNYENALDIVNRGHQLGNHSYSHTRMLLKSRDFVESEITKTNELIKNLGYTGTIHFRTPYGKKLVSTPYYLWKNNMFNILFDVEPESYVSDSEDILSYTINNTKSGSIILLHPMYGGSGNQSLQILDKLIIGLKDKGFEFVTVDELLAETNYKTNFWFK